MSKRLWILEGPDGGGKSTLAAQLAAGNNAVTVHCGPFPNVNKGLARLYVEAMLPALLGHRNVILDRSWLSEPIYAEARRHTSSRLSVADMRMLDRVAARCCTTVVRCLPPLATCLATYQARRPTEYLKNETQLKLVHTLYSSAFAPALPVVDVDYTAPTGWALKLATATRPHPLAVVSAGFLDAPIMLVGEAHGAVKEHDPLQQYPFVSFSNSGCARWLTMQLDRAGIFEESLLWVNADQDLGALFNAGARPCVVVALGATAADRVNALTCLGDIEVLRVDHPQHAKRFHHTRTYALLKLLEAYL